MKVTLTGLIRDAWQYWRRDTELLIAIAGLFVFLPALALFMLVPGLPHMPDSVDPAVPATMIPYQRLVAAWILQYGPWILGAQLLSFYGQFAIVAMYLSGARPAVGSALVAALRRLPVLLLASFVVAVPLVIVMTLFALAPVLLPGFVIATTIVAGRALLIMPVIHAESPIGAFAATGRSFRLTHGSTLMLAAGVLTVYLGIQLIAWPFAALDGWMASAANVIARTIVDSFEAAIVALGNIAMALLAVSAYRRLSSS